jgi:hypothetical protein
MCSAILFLLVTAVDSASVNDSRFPEAVEIFRCRFDGEADKNFDTWPDDWTRKKGTGFPAYTKIHIQPQSSPGGAACLRIELDGGGAAAFSPPIPADVSFGYVMEAEVNTEGLEHDGAFLSLTFLDGDKHTLSTAESEPITKSDGWKRIRLGTIESSDPNVRWIQVGLHVEPRDQADLHGAVNFRDVWLGRLPRMELKTNHPQNLFIRPAGPKITCTASGIENLFSEVSFELLDAFGETLSKESRPLTLETPSAARHRNPEAGPAAAASQYVADWTPSIPRPGFYRVRMGLTGSVPTADRREITLVSLEPRLPPPHGTFGWSLPNGPRPLAPADLSELLIHCGISWVKYPVWCSDEDGGRCMEQILEFAEKLSNAGIEMAGMLLEPPEPAREKFGGTGSLTAATVFDSDPKNWYPSLEPVIIQLSNKVHCWQLGRDTDLSLLVLPNFIEKLRAIRGQLEQAMQGMEMCIGWNWDQDLPSGNAAAALPWNIVSISSDPPLPSDELAKSLDVNRQSPLKSWVVLSPLARGEQPLDARADDLVARMVAAKVHGAAAVFCPDPFHPTRGLLKPDGTPTDLFIPWRTTALEIGGGRFIGEMILPRASKNHVFVRDKDAVMYVWNRRPTEEVIYLGEHVQQSDIWGRVSDALGLDGKQLIEVNQRPTFITGIDKAVAQWSVGLQIEKSRLSSVFGQTLSNRWTVENFFSRDIDGKATFVTPRGWIIEPDEVKFHAATGEKVTQEFKIDLPSDANNGANLVRIDFEIQADRPYRFSVYRSLEVGTNDVRIDVQTRLNKKNELEVEQRFVNDTDKRVSFRCELSAPDRRRLAAQILDQGRGEQTQVYRLDDGKSLVGKPLWLRAEEIDGPRILNYQITAEK